MEKKKPKTIQPEHKIKHLGDNRYKSQRGSMIATFEIGEDCSITFFDGLKSDVVKGFHFKQSEPGRVWAMSLLLRDAVKQAERLAKQKEKT